MSIRRRQFLQTAACAPLALSPGALFNSAAAASSPAGSDARAGAQPWRPDGWGWRGALGQLIPHNDTVPDTEFAALAPDGVSTHAMRVRYGGVVGSGATMTRARSFADPPHVDDGAELLADIRPGAVAYCFTSSSRRPHRTPTCGPKNL